MTVRESKAYKYAKWCVQEEQGHVGTYVKKQAAAWLLIADGKHEKAYTSDKELNKICKLLRIMKHPDTGGNMYESLEDYAWFLITAVFCTLERGTDCRYYVTALLEIARKNFKTFNAGVIFIIAMLTEPRF